MNLVTTTGKLGGNVFGHWIICFIINYWKAELMLTTLFVLHLIQQMIFISLEKAWFRLKRKSVELILKSSWHISVPFESPSPNLLAKDFCNLLRFSILLYPDRLQKSIYHPLFRNALPIHADLLWFLDNGQLYWLEHSFLRYHAPPSLFQSMREKLFLP